MSEALHRLPGLYLCLLMWNVYCGSVCMPVCVRVRVNDGGRGAALWDQMIHSVSKHFKHFFHFEFVTIASTCLKFSAKRTLINVQAVKGATR